MESSKRKWVSPAVESFDLDDDDVGRIADAPEWQEKLIDVYSEKKREND